MAKKQKKSWSDLTAKEKVAGVIGILVILFLLIMLKGLIFGGPSDNKSGNTSNASVSGMSEEDQLKQIATKAATEGDGLAKAVREVRVIPEADGSHSMNVVFHDNSGQYGAIKQTMGNVYYELLKSGKKLETITVAAKSEYRDDYGNAEEIIVLQTQLTKKIAQKINLDADKSVLQVEIIPGLWQQQKIHPDIQKQI